MNNIAESYRSGIGLILVSRKHQAVFVGCRKDENSGWQLPQGGIDPEEDLEIALRREAREEIGTDNFRIVCQHAQWLYYDLPISVINEGVANSSWDRKYTGQRIKWFLCEFLGDDSEININTNNPEFIDWKWSPFPNCFASIIYFKRDMYFKIASAFMVNILRVGLGQPVKETEGLIILKNQR